MHITLDLTVRRFSIKDYEGDSIAWSKAISRLKARSREEKLGFSTRTKQKKKLKTPNNNNVST